MYNHVIQFVHPHAAPLFGVQSIRVIGRVDEGQQTLVLEPDALGAELDAVSNFFHQVLNTAGMQMVLNAEDQVGLVVETETQEGIPVVTYISRRAWSSITADVIVEQLMARLNSNESLMGSFEITVFKTQAPATVELQVGKRFRYNGSVDAFFKSKRCIVTILPANDKVGKDDTCVSQWIMLGTLHLLQNNVPLSPELELVVDALQWTPDMFKMATSGRDRFDLRERWTSQLRDLLEIPEGPLNDASITYLQDLLHVHLVLLDMTKRFQPIFPKEDQLPLQMDRPTIFGITASEKDVVEHVHLLTKPQALLPGSNKVRYCIRCLQHYNRKNRCTNEKCLEGQVCFICHQCNNACPSCCTMGECDFQRQHATSSCSECNVLHYGDLCKTLHDHYCPNKHWKRCERCNRKQHSGLQCDEYRCALCMKVEKMKDKNEHQCYLMQRKLSPPKETYCVYDFECAIDTETQRHVPYLATAWFPLGHPQMEELTTSYPHEFLPTDPRNPVFVFWGLKTPEFFNFIRDKRMHGYDFFAHNARAYDNVLIKETLMSEYRLFSEDIRRGRKFLEMRFPDLEISFKDSVSFIPSALRYLADDFGIEELAKGHFPHRLLTVQNLEKWEPMQFQVQPFPNRDVFDTDFGTGGAALKHHEEAERWLDTLYANPPTVWDLKGDAIRYCISDTVLLGKVLLKFRQECLNMTTSIPRAEGVADIQPLDPLQFVTLPSAIMRFYMSQCLPADTISVIDRFVVMQKRKALTYLQHIQQTRFPDLAYEVALYSSDGRFMSRADGYDVDTRTVFFFHGCYWHGCPKCHRDVAVNTRLQKTFGELLAFTNDKTARLRREGYQVEEMWECQWLEQGVTDEDVLPLDPREAYRGGKSEMYKHRVDGEIEMVDFVSQYPTSMLGTSYDPHSDDVLHWPLPIGHPTRVLGESVTTFLEDTRLGVVKCKVLPPGRLYAPFLSMKVDSVLNSSSYEVLYGLCRTCMETRSMEDCTHADEERCFVGTWTNSEIRYAVSIGYQVLKVYEVWYYDTSSEDLFRDFIVPFMVNKICSKKSGLVTEAGIFTDKGVQVAEYIQSMRGHAVTPEEFVNNPARRTVSKLIQNAFTGKWGQKEDHDSTATFYAHDRKKAWALLFDSQAEILNIDILSGGDAISVNYKPRAGSTTGHLHKNDHIVAHITAYGRMMLSRLECRLGRNMIYCDTDSGYHRKLENRPYKVGFRTGDLELELTNASGWVGLGRKSYAYKENGTGKVVSKQKGVSLNMKTLPLFTPERLLQLLRVDNTDQIEVEQTMFVTEYEDHVPYKKTVQRKKKIRFHANAPKRRILWEVSPEGEIETLPFGWK